jgi:glycyl-tRNA synthetase beta chain
LHQQVLAAFVDTEDGRNLVAGWKRAANILGAEEKKGTTIEHILDARKLHEPAEIALFEAMNEATNKAGHAVDAEDFEGAMRALAALRAPVDAFLDKVLVNDPDPAVRMNRLVLLNELRRATARVADFSKLSG